MKINKILISRPKPAIGNSPFADLETKYKIGIDFQSFFRIEPVSCKDFRAQKINVLNYSAIVFTGKTVVDAFFNLCKELKVAVPETMKYFCSSEQTALYLQKHIVYRKRKIFFGNGKMASVIDLINAKHKDEKYLIATTDNNKNEYHKLFARAKIQHDIGVFAQTVFEDLKGIDPEKYQIIVFYSPMDAKSWKMSFPDYLQNGNTVFAAYGPATIKCLKENNYKVAISAPSAKIPSIAKAVELYISADKHA
ncbi:MAG: uroporphyrinogen-III synthase [Bacteroidales bacterium]|jgi:uroporphyrinogen-III synthase|nr:uroporphyrinogen-III synthase [Bacteroidales bacterium]